MFPSIYILFFLPIRHLIGVITLTLNHFLQNTLPIIKDVTKMLSRSVLSYHTIILILAALLSRNSRAALSGALTNSNVMIMIVYKGPHVHGCIIM